MIYRINLIKQVLLCKNNYKFKITQIKCQNRKNYVKEKM